MLDVALAPPGSHDVTIVGHAALPGGAPDDVLLATALRRRGVSTRFAVWDDPEVDWKASPLAVVRSVWDYHRTPERWLAWIERAGAATRLLNTPPLLRWNTDKRYVRDLREHGVPCVPTEFVEPGASAALQNVMSARGWSDVVVKPAVAASACGARRFNGASILAGDAHLRDLASRGVALVQPYLPAVETLKERSLVFVAGQFVHAFTKPAFSANAVGATDVRPHVASAEEMALAAKSLAAAPGRVSYARVDLVPNEGGPLLMELELIEPDLGLRLNPDAADHLAQACSAAFFATV